VVGGPVYWWGGGGGGPAGGGGAVVPPPPQQVGFGRDDPCRCPPRPAIPLMTSMVGTRAGGAPPCSPKPAVTRPARQIAEYGVPEGAGLGDRGSRRMASCGESWNCGLEAAGAFVVALAARSWFCCHRLFGCCCGSDGAAPGWLTWPRWAGAFSWARACGC